VSSQERFGIELGSSLLSFRAARGVMLARMMMECRDAVRSRMKLLDLANRR
jgi:hypothetical protein